MKRRMSKNGFAKSDVADLMRRLPTLAIARSPAKGTEKKRNVKWVRPAITVEVRYPNKSEDGRLRHPSFKGLRDE